MTLWKVVRPFQTRDISAPKPVAAGSGTSTSTDNPDNAVSLEYGRSWAIRTLNGSVSIDIQYYAIKKMRERAKTT